MRDPHLSGGPPKETGGRPAVRPARAPQKAPGSTSKATPKANAPWPSLVAVAHGSSDPRAAATVADLMSAVEARASASGLSGLPVRQAFLGHALPSVSAVLESLAADGAQQQSAAQRAVIVLPLLLTPAYHSDTDLPAILREMRARLPDLRIRYGQPLGPHPRLLRALERRLREAAQNTTPENTALVLAAAGSSRPASNAAVARLAAQWQSARGWRAVVPAYASAASPAPADAVASLLGSGAKRVVVATYLLAPGFFADQVREQSLAAGAQAVSAPLGAAPEVADVIVLRYLQAARAITGRRAFAI